MTPNFVKIYLLGFALALTTARGEDYHAIPADCSELISVVRQAEPNDGRAPATIPPPRIDLNFSNGTDAESASIKEFIVAMLKLDSQTLWTDEDLSKVGTYYASHKGKLTVARNAEGKIIATAGYRMVDSKTVELKRVYLDPVGRGQGIGKLMVQEMIRSAQTAGFRKMILTTTPNSFDAIRLYERLGFKRNLTLSAGDRLVFELKLPAQTRPYSY